MKRRAEAELLRLEDENRRLERTERTERVDAASDATTASTASPASTTATLLFDTEACAEFFHTALYEKAAKHILPSNVADSHVKTRVVLDATYSAFCVLVCVEGVAPVADTCVFFALILWIAEIALASFFDAPAVKDVDEGHAKAFWELMKTTAYSPARRGGSDMQHPHELQRAARAAWRESEAADFDCPGYRDRMFDDAKRITEASVALTFVITAGCKGANAQFTPPQHPPSHSSPRSGNGQSRPSPRRR